MSAVIEGLEVWLQRNWSEVPALLMWVGIGAAAAMLFYFVLRLLRDASVRFLRGRDGARNAWRRILATVIASTWRISFAVFATSLAAAMLGLSPQWLKAIVGATLVVQSGLWLGTFLRELIATKSGGSTSDRSALASATSLMQMIVNAVVWSVVALVLLGNMGIDVTALVAGFGIGGIAIGLAAQSIFADLFASLSIALDRPFVRGDFIIFGEHMGSIERIGVKSTRIRSLSGEQIVVSNAQLLQATIRNYQLLRERRVLFKLGVVYRTSAENIAAIPRIVRDAIVERSRTRFERCHFREFGDFALTFEIVYFVLDPDYNVYMDTQHEINVAIMRAFATHGIEFAFPTHSVFLESQGEEGRQVGVAGKSTVLRANVGTVL